MMIQKLKRYFKELRESSDKTNEKLDLLLQRTQSNERGPNNSLADVKAKLERDADKLLTSGICKEIDFTRPWFSRWSEELKENPRLHRKLWEFTFICQALFERGQLTTGKKGLGFAVGTEPLPALFAKYGATITATDLDPESGEEKGWANGNQLSYGLTSMNTRGICPPEQFNKLVAYRTVDMNDIPNDLEGYDFTWSACAFEHLGSIQKGLDFVKNQMKTLKPGGWAVHTSEYNISSNDETLETEGAVIFRQRDYQSLLNDLRNAGHHVEEVDYSLGWLPTDFFVDLPPYRQDPHTRLQLGKFVTTSIGLIIQKKV